MGSWTKSYPLIGKKSKLNPRDKMILIKAAIMKMMIYASVECDHATKIKRQLKELEKNESLKCSRCAMKKEHTSITEVMKTRARKAFAKFSYHTNGLMTELLDYELRIVNIN